ncbi:MAG: hypothetical protein FRX49_13294 [Trebouxia sp. A1-2]|nr:MAG: hypothetical protein FRX49_13294 [Trebouxia sp. A1-2]
MRLPTGALYRRVNQSGYILQEIEEVREVQAEVELKIQQQHGDSHGGVWRDLSQEWIAQSPQAGLCGQPVL